MKTIKRAGKNGDFFFTIVVLALVVFGVIMVFSASYYSSMSKSGNAYAYLFKEIFYAGIGLIGMICFSMLDYRRMRKVGPVLVGIGIILLIVVLFKGTEVNGAQRWIYLGPVSIMPGELIKFFMIIFIAGYFGRRPELINKFFRGVVPVLAITMVAVLLIIKQPNYSTAMTLLLIVGGMLIVAGLPGRYVAFLCVAGGVLGGVALVSGDSAYRMSRMVSFMDPFKDFLGDGYQVCQGLYALGTGGMFGRGLGNSIQKNLYLPEPQNDFILAIIGEELGYVGIIILMLAYVFLIYKGFKIALNAPDRFGRYLAAGITIMIAVQVVLNIAIVTASAPPTGVILPFVSYGGNALVIFMCMAGILMNIRKHEVM